MALKIRFMCTLRDDLRIDIIENVWIETQDLIIGVIYKLPSLFGYKIKQLG